MKTSLVPTSVNVRLIYRSSLQYYFQYAHTHIHTHTIQLSNLYGAIVCCIVTGGQLWQSYIPLSLVSSLMTARWCHKGNEIWRIFRVELSKFGKKYFKKYSKSMKHIQKFTYQNMRCKAGLHTNRNTLVFRWHGHLKHVTNVPCKDTNDERHYAYL